MRKNWLLTGIAVLIAVLAIGAIACGDSGDDEEAPTATEVQPDDDVAEPTSTNQPDEPAPTPTTIDVPAADPTAVADNIAEPTEDFTGLENDVLFHTLYDSGGILTGDDFLTLYVFDNDGPGVSNCTGSCADVWPPYIPTAPGSDGLTANWDGNLSFDGTISTVLRENGDLQVTFYGQPLYHYTGDVAIDDRNGDGIGGVWHIVVIGE